MKSDIKHHTYMAMTDIQCELFTNAGPSMGMKLTHIPTGLSVAGTGNLRNRLRKELMEELRLLIKDKDNELN